MAINVNDIGNVITPAGASMIFGVEATEDKQDISELRSDSYSPYTIVYVEDDEEDTLPANQVSYSPPGDSHFEATNVQEALDQFEDLVNNNVPQLIKETKTATDGQVSFVLSKDFQEKGMLVFLNGILLNVKENYTYSNKTVSLVDFTAEADDVLTVVGLASSGGSMIGASSSSGVELSDDLPAAAGSASAGTSTEASRADHVHPQEVSASDRTKWNNSLTEAKSYTNTQIATRAPQYLYGARDLVDGESDLASGILYFVYEGGEVSFTFNDSSYTVKEGMTWEEWIASDYNTANIGSKYDKYVIVDDRMLLDSNDECVFLTDEIAPNSSFTGTSYYFTFTIDLSGCEGSGGTSLDGQSLTLMGKNYITFEEFVNRKESQNLFYLNSHFGISADGWALRNITKGGYPAEITVPADSYLSIDNGGSYSSSTSYWVP